MRRWRGVLSVAFPGFATALVSRPAEPGATQAGVSEAGFAAPVPAGSPGASWWARPGQRAGAAAFAGPGRSALGAASVGSGSPWASGLWPQGSRSYPLGALQSKVAIRGFQTLFVSVERTM